MFWDSYIKGYHVIDSLQENFDVVQKEILEYIDNPDILVDYPNYAVKDHDRIYEHYWKATPCSVFRDEHVEIYGTPELEEFLLYLVSQFRSHCPVTYSCIKEDEYKGLLCNSFISRLVPNSIINPHSGWSQKYMRVHLGIKTDPDCKITVGDDTRTWEEGKVLAFNDGDEHSVKHLGTRERIVFSFDVEGEYIDTFMKKSS